MKLLQVLKAALAQVSRSKLRTLLTMLGLIVGVSSVIAVVGLGEGSSQEVEEQLESLGGNILSGYLFDEFVTYEDFKQIRDLDSVENASPSKIISAEVSYEKKKAGRAMIEASDEYYLDTCNLKLETGRNLTSVDRNNKSKVCVIGSTVAQDLYGSTDVVGKSVRLNGNHYTIIGVLQQQGEVMGLSSDNLVLIPFTLIHEFGAEDKIDSLYVRASEEAGVPSAKEETSTFFTSEKQIPSTNFWLGSQDEFLSAGESIDESMTILLAGIAGISLIVAGIGVMNVMLVSVAERVREIGIKKALGARRGDILIQFLLEALVISMVGGALGVVVGLLFGVIANEAGVRFEPSGQIIVISVAASVVVGLVFGIFPAYRASRLNPIDALRQE